MKTTLTVLLILQLYGLASCVIKQHYFIDEMKTWDEALNHCRTNYHDLSTFIDKTEEQQFKQDTVDQTSDGWVGLNTRSGTWKWTTGEVATGASWDTGKPGRLYCAMLHKDSKKLHDDHCLNSIHTFFCMNVSVNTVLVQQDNRTFFRMNVSEFVVVQQSESWEGALEYCRHHHDDLASLNSSRRMTDALSKISGAQTQHVWIGLRFLAGGWFWISGDDLIFKVWSSAGQLQCPAQNQRCAALDKITRTWTPRDCEEKLSFLCFGQPEEK